MGNVNQVGEWTVPSRIHARCSMGNVKIDFSRAICRHREVWLRAECGWGNIKVLVPRGWTVAVESMTVGSGQLANKANQPGDPGMPVLHVEGSVSAGSIKIRYAN
jgi:predicted membrane protein